MGLARATGTIVFTACVLLPACNHDPTPSELLQNRKVDEKQKARAVEAANDFRQSFNSGACRPIYDRAAAYFRSEESEDWLHDCQRLRKELGSWRDFRVVLTRRCGKPDVVICLAGSADFEKQTTEVGIDIVLDGDRALLRSLSIRDGDQHWTQIPRLPLPFPQWRRRWIDPPPAKSPEHGVAL